MYNYLQRPGPSQVRRVDRALGRVFFGDTLVKSPTTGINLESVFNWLVVILSLAHFSFKGGVSTDCEI